MSKNTENYKLYTFTSDSDVADLKLLEPTFDTIDKGLVLDVGESTGSGNNYILNLGSITLTSANKGISFKFWSDKDSKGAVTINGTYKLIKANGNSVTNLKAGAPYTITYDGGTNFFLASGGGLDDVNFTSDKLLTGYSANNSNGEKVDGTMQNRGTMNVNLSLNGQNNLPSGYYSGINITQNVTTRGAHTNAISNGVDDNYLYTRIPVGAYFTKSSIGYPEIRSKLSDVSNALKNLSDDKKDEIVGDLGGASFASGSINVKWDGSATNEGAIRFSITGLSFTPKIVLCKSYKSGESNPRTTFATFVNPDFSNIYASGDIFHNLQVGTLGYNNANNADVWGVQDLDTSFFNGGMSSKICFKYRYKGTYIVEYIAIG